MTKCYRIAVVPFGMFLLVLTGCEFDTAVSGPLRDETISVDLNKAERAAVNLDMAAGELSVRSGTAKLVDGRVEYNVPSWKPEVTTETGQMTTVTIRQPKNGHMGGNTRYRWDLNLNDTIPLDLEVNCGAGQARLELGDMDLENVNVHMGAGQVDLDLEGHPDHSYSVNIAGGVGQATVRIPRNVGVRAEAHGGLGSIQVRGLTKHDGYYSNDLYGNGKVNVLLKVEGGIGEIRILG